MKKEVSILNRTFRWKSDMIEYEAGSRHVEIIIEECEVISCKIARTPGDQDSDVQNRRAQLGLDYGGPPGPRAGRRPIRAQKSRPHKASE